MDGNCKNKKHEEHLLKEVDHNGWPIWKDMTNLC